MNINMIRQTQHYTEKYPIFNGNRYLSMTDTTTLSNLSGLTEGVIEGSFRFENGSFLVVNNLSQDTTNSDRIWVDVTIADNLTYNSALRFNYNDDFTDVDLSFYINSLPYDYFVDGEVHEYKIILDPTNGHNIIVDNINYQSNISFGNGTSTTPLFIPTNLSNLTIGVRKFVNINGLSLFGYCKGIIYSTSIKSLDELTTYYSVDINGEIIDASATTTLIKNTILDLQYNNSNVDISDNPKTVTASGTETYVDGRYGESLSAREFTGTQYELIDVSSESGTYDNLTVSCFIKNNSTISDTYTNAIFTPYNTRVYDNSSIYFFVNNVFCNLNIGLRDFDGNVYRRIYELFEILDKWTHIVVKFDYINKTLVVIVNGKDISENYTTSSDLSNMTPLAKDRDFYIGALSSILGNDANCDIYTNRVRNYLMSDEESKAEYKKYSALIQELSYFDFDNSLYKDKNGYDATLTGNNCAYMSLLATYQSQTFNSSLLDITQDHTIMIRGYISNGGLYLYWGGRSNQRIEFLITDANVYVNNVSYRQKPISPDHQADNLIVIRRSGTNLRIYMKGVLVYNKTVPIPPSNTNLIMFTTGNRNWFTEISRFVIYKSAIPTTDITDLGLPAITDLDEYILDTNLADSIFNYAEGNGDKAYDCVSGEESLFDYDPWTTSSYSFNVNNFRNLKYGFELYTDDATGLIRILVPLRYDGVSLGKVITGYTSQGVVSQSGNEFLNCETKLKQIDTVYLPNFDPNGFWYSGITPLEKRFTNFDGTQPSYVSYTEVDSNKIKDIKLRR